VAHLPDRPPGFGQRRRQSGKQRVRRQMIEMERRVLRLQVFGERLHCVGFAAAPDDCIQVVRARETGSEKLQAPQKRQPAAGCRERRDGNQLTPAAHRQNGQTPRFPQMRPPCVQPLPREKWRFGRARLEQTGPVRLQRLKPPRIVDELNCHDVLRFGPQTRPQAPRPSAVRPDSETLLPVHPHRREQAPHAATSLSQRKSGMRAGLVQFGNPGRPECHRMR
jgi:hypothetical protein